MSGFGLCWAALMKRIKGTHPSLRSCWRRSAFSLAFSLAMCCSRTKARKSWRARTLSLDVDMVCFAVTAAATPALDAADARARARGSGGM